jgi:hypothetical protein
VRVTQATGTSPPSSSTTTTPQSRTYTFQDNDFGESFPTDTHPRCADSFGTRFSADLGDLGIGAVTILACVMGQPPATFVAEVVDVLVTVVLDAGVLSGTGFGEIRADRLPGPVSTFRVTTNLALEFTDGTGSLTGAVGTGSFHRVTEPFVPTVNGFGGTITVPAT